MNDPSAATGKSKLFRRFFTAFVFVLFLIIVLGVVREHSKRRELDREIAGLQAEVKKLEATKKDFLQSVELYQSDFFIEKEAREKFNLKKAGEQVSVIPSDAASNVAADSAVAGDLAGSVGPLPGGNARDWWHYFFAKRGQSMAN